MITAPTARRLRIGGAATIATLALAGISACSSGSPGPASAGSATGSSAHSAAGDFAAPATADSLSKLDGSSLRTVTQAKAASATSSVMSRQVISTGDISLITKDVANTRSDILHAVSGWNGWVANEETSADDQGTVKHVWLTLRVPSARFDDAMSGVAGLAHATHESRSAKDVTTKVIDTNARVRAKQRALAQLERLLDRANTLGQVIRLEGDISARQAELDSLKHQQAYLKDQTSLSTITVDVSRQRSATATTHHTGLFHGFRAGAHAFKVATLAALTAIGTVAPFAALIAVIGVPVWLVRRRRSGRVDVVDQAS